MGGSLPLRAGFLEIRPIRDYFMLCFGYAPNQSIKCAHWPYFSAIPRYPLWSLAKRGFLAPPLHFIAKSRQRIVG